MKTTVLLAALTLLAACTPPQGEDRAATAESASAPQSQPETPVPMSEMPQATAGAVAATAASATGVVENIDARAGKITIAHGPVDALKWPAMTMTFKAPDVDLGAIKQGDHVTFEFTSSGMDGTITTITRQ